MMIFYCNKRKQTNFFEHVMQKKGRLENLETTKEINGKSRGRQPEKYLDGWKRLGHSGDHTNIAFRGV